MNEPAAHLPFDALNAALKAAGEDDAAARAGAAGGGRTDGLRPHRHPAPVAAAHLAPSEAAGRGRPGRALPRRRLGVLPAGRSAAAAPSLRARWWRGSIPRTRWSLRDRDRLTAVRRARADAAQDYFRAHAAQWDRIRKLHVTDEAVEGAIRDALADKPFRSLLDLGTGTGRILELFGPNIERGLGIDLSLDMLLLARARLERAGLRHCSVRQGDIYDLAVPASSFDVVVIHQVLHFLDDGGARDPRGGARAGAVGGRLLVVDFAPHDLEFLREEHAHRRLGFADETVAQWMSAAGLDVTLHQSLPPEPGSDGKIAVSLWLGARSAHPDRRQSRARWRDGDADARFVRVLSAEDRGDGEESLGGGRSGLRRCIAEFRLGDLRRRRLDARAHPRDGAAHPQRDRADAGRASDLRRGDQDRDRRGDPTPIGTAACATSWRCAAIRPAASATNTRRIRAAIGTSADLVAGIKRIGDIEVSVSAYPEKHPGQPERRGRHRHAEGQGRCRRDARDDAVLLRERPLFPLSRQGAGARHRYPDRAGHPAGAELQAD